MGHPLEVSWLRSQAGQAGEVCVDYREPVWQQQQQHEQQDPQHQGSQQEDPLSSGVRKERERSHEGYGSRSTAWDRVGQCDSGPNFASSITCSSAIRRDSDRSAENNIFEKKKREVRVPPVDSREGRMPQQSFRGQQAGNSYPGRHEVGSFEVADSYPEAGQVRTHCCNCPYSN